MERFWDLITEPVLVDRKPQRLVQIGARASGSTLRLLELAAATEAYVDIIDSTPPDNLGELNTLFPAYGAYHQARVLDVLHRLPVADVYIFAGDPNWYTVYHGLKSILKTVVETQHRAPLILVHDVGWPYGRRDAYPDLAAVPTSDRRPHRQGGLRPPAAEPVDDGGLNYTVSHALHEGGAHNGVRSAVDEFLSEVGSRYRYFHSDAFGGLGFLIPSVDQRHPYAARAARFCEVPTMHAPLVRHLERQRVGARADAADLRWQLEKTRETLRSAEAEIAQHADRVAKLEQALGAIRSTRGFQALETVRSVRRRVQQLVSFPGLGRG